MDNQWKRDTCSRYVKTTWLSNTPEAIHRHGDKINSWGDILHWMSDLRNWTVFTTTKVVWWTLQLVDCKEIIQCQRWTNS